MNMTQQQEKLNDYKRKYPASFESARLDNSLSTFQLWAGGTMFTAQLSKDDAISGVDNGSYYVISNQAVGTINSLLS